MSDRDERIKQLMQDVGMPKSLCLYQAFKAIENEMGHEINGLRQNLNDARDNLKKSNALCNEYAVQVDELQQDLTDARNQLESAVAVNNELNYKANTLSYLMRIVLEQAKRDYLQPETIATAEAALNEHMRATQGKVRLVEYDGVAASEHMGPWSQPPSDAYTFLYAAHEPKQDIKND